MIVKPDEIVTDDTFIVPPPVFVTLIPTPVESVLRRTSPKLTEPGFTTMWTGGGVPVPFSVTVFVVDPLFSRS